MAKTKFKENFKEILKELRKKKNLTQRELAEKTGISLAMITKYEQGLNTPSIENLRVLADFFKVPLREFLEDRNRDRFFKDFFSEKEANIDIENYDFSQVSLYDFLTTRNHCPYTFKRELIVSFPSNRISKLLKNKGYPVYSFQYIGYDQNGEVVEYTRSYIRSDKGSYRFVI